MTGLGGVTGGQHAWPVRPDESSFVRPLVRLLNGGGWRVVPCCGAIIAVAVALVVSHQAGYPLDDSWIHQDFARTLATAHQFAFSPGQAGAGSTSPLWVLVLTPPYVVFGATPPLAVIVGWSAALGAASLAALAVLTGSAAADLAARARASTLARWLAALLASAAVVTEWHLVWAAASGMETVLFSTLVMAVLVLASRGAPAWRLGLLSAVTVAVRPEGVALAALLAVASLWSAARRQTGWRALVGLRVWAVRWGVPFSAVFLLALIPYLLLNLHASGRVLPSTIAAKSAYYGQGELLAALGGYAEQVVVVMLVSSPALVLLGVLSYSHRLLAPPLQPSEEVDRQARRAGHDALSPALPGLLVAWPTLLLLAYAGRLPVLYHNGRYLMPGLAPLMALGAAGAISLLVQRRLLSRVSVGLLALAGAFSLLRGAQIYGDNVRFINACQVDTAKWLSAHTTTGSLIATHDIGAIGYFSHRPVLDIAGLVDPQVTPYLNDQSRLEAYARAHHAAYVVEFTDWFGPPNTLLRDLTRAQVYHARGSARFVVLRTDW